MLKKAILLFTLCLIWVSKTNAQDAQFSQFYAAPLYLNPGFAGATVEHRFIVNNRIQWPSLPKTFTTYNFSYDFNMHNLNSGLGILATSDRAGIANLQSTTINAIYSYKIKFNHGWIVSPGIQFGYNIRTLDFDKLIFGDQINFDDNLGSTIDPDFKFLENQNSFDFSSGIMVYNKNAWFGFSAHHLNKPNNSVINEGQSALPTKYSLHAGYRITLFQGPTSGDRLSSIAPSFIYKKQGEFDQLDIGFHFHYNPIMAGFWYRGIPIKQDVDDNSSRDAIIILFGLKFEQFDVGYSYDMTTSKLGGSTGGAHEISLTYQFNTKHRKKSKPQKFIPCPAY